jgi:hypothetical protein
MTNLIPPKVAMETHFGSHSLTREERIRRAAALSDEVKVTDLSSDSVSTDSESDTEPTPG